MDWWDMQLLGVAFCIWGRVEDRPALAAFGWVWLVFSFITIVARLFA